MNGRIYDLYANKTIANRKSSKQFWSHLDRYKYLNKPDCCPNGLNAKCAGIV